MIIDALNGEKNILAKYEKYRNVPEKDNPNYKLVYHYSRLDDDEFLEDDEDYDDENEEADDDESLLDDIIKVIDSYEDDNINEESLLRLKNYLKNNLAKYEKCIVIELT